jgi:arabinogalactan endo-1,4-beta-galactosidase
MYRTVYRIVFEKFSKAKESMRMMGMSDFPYWASWIL